MALLTDCTVASIAPGATAVVAANQNAFSFGPDHPDVATALNNLAMLLKYANRRGDSF